MKKSVFLVLCLTFLLSATGFVGCGKQEDSHTHSFTQQKIERQYLASPATCTEKAKYFFSCKCGEKGSATFEHGSAKGHTYSEEWSHNNAEHWHAATCGHSVDKDRAKHTFDSNKKCTVCDYVTAKPLGLELQSSAFIIDPTNKTAYLKVANAVTDYDFSDKFTVADGARFDVCTDKQCNDKIASKKTDIAAGDNVFYILVTNGNDVASYTITLRRRPIYTVAFNTNGGSAVKPQQIEEDSFAVKPTSARAGYNFVAWDYDFSLPVLKDETITASWNIITYKITYVLYGGENSESNPATYTVEDDITLSLPTKTGYSFESWSDSGKIEKGSVGDITFIASWQINTYKITYVLNGGNNPERNPLTYTVEDDIILSLPTKTGYTGSWDNGGKIEKGSVGDITFIASWDIITYKITYILNGGENSESNPKTYTVENYVVLSLPTRTGYTGNWDNGGKIEKGSVGDKIFTANWNIITYNIIYIVNGGKNSENNPATYTVEDYIALSLPTKTGYTGSWDNGGRIQKGSVGDKTFTASYTINKYTVSVTPSISNSCSFTDNSGIYDYNTTIALVLSDVYLGYEFLGWYNGDNLLSTDKTYTMTIPANSLSIIAKLSVKEEMKDFAFSSTTDTCTITDVKNKTITNAIVPDYVTNIESGAFRGCSSLTKITLPFIGAGLNETTNSHFGYIFGASTYSDNIDYVPNSLKSIIIADKGSIKSIKANTFYNCNSLTSVTIPDGVVSIGESAFYGCSGLTSINIPNNMTNIYDKAFNGCSSLTRVIFPDSVSYIGYHAFENCIGLKALTIGKNVYSMGESFLGDSAFTGCSGLESIIVSPDNSKYHSDGNCLIKTASKLLFLGCKNSVIPADGSVALIGRRAFEGCSSLTSIIIPDGVTSIGSGAFNGCSGLTSINIPDGVTSIEINTFNGCSSLTSITIPDSVTSIGSGAFNGCSGLTSINIPDGVTSIEVYMFNNCSSLTSITIGSGVESIGNYAFWKCSSLKEIHYNGTKEQWNDLSKRIGNWFVWNNGKTITIYFSDGTTTTITT